MEEVEKGSPPSLEKDLGIELSEVCCRRLLRPIQPILPLGCAAVLLGVERWAVSELTCKLNV